LCSSHDHEESSLAISHMSSLLSGLEGSAGSQLGGSNVQLEVMGSLRAQQAHKDFQRKFELKRALYGAD
jgi:hypothetical protein